MGTVRLATALRWCNTSHLLTSRLTLHSVMDAYALCSCMVAGRAVIMHILCVRTCRWRWLQLSMPWHARALYICATYAPICSYISAYSTHTSQTNALKHMHTGWSLFDAISLMRPWQAETTLASNYRSSFKVSLQFNIVWWIIALLYIVKTSVTACCRSKCK